MNSRDRICHSIIFKYTSTSLAQSVYAYSLVLICSKNQRG
jgi:hypothetical protein